MCHNTHSILKPRTPNSISICLVASHLSSLLWHWKNKLHKKFRKESRTRLNSEQRDDTASLLTCLSSSSLLFCRSKDPAQTRGKGQDLNCLRDWSFGIKLDWIFIWKKRKTGKPCDLRSRDNPKTRKGYLTKPVGSSVEKNKRFSFILSYSFSWDYHNK